MSHAIWMFQPGKAGQQHNDTPMRTIHASAVAKFKNAWDLLQSPAIEIPFEPTPSFIAAASRGCPDDAWLAQYATSHPFYASLDLTADWQQLRAAIQGASL